MAATLYRSHTIKGEFMEMIGVIIRILFRNVKSQKIVSHRKVHIRDLILDITATIHSFNNNTHYAKPF